LDVFLDTRVIEALAKALSSFINLSIDEAVNKRFADLTSSVSELKKETTHITKITKRLTTENKQLNERVAALESYTRGDNLIMRGLPERSASERASASPALGDIAALSDSHRSVEESVIELCQSSLGIDVMPSDISTAHRLKASPKDKYLGTSIDR